MFRLTWVFFAGIVLSFAQSDAELGGTVRDASGAVVPGVAVTVSIGLAERNGRYDTPQEVIEAADRALYRAKEKGRNRLSR